MATKAQIRDYVRQQTLIEEDDWADSKIDVEINRALSNLASRFKWPWLAATGTLSVVASTTSYTMPTDLAKSDSIIRKGERQRLIEVSPHEILAVFGDDLPTGDPVTYYVHGRNIFLDRVPRESADYTWLYYKAPTLLNDDTDEPAFDSQFHFVLADYAIAKAWRREEDFPKAEDAMADFERGVQEMAGFYLDVSKDRPIVFGQSRSRTANYGRGGGNTPWLNGL